MVLFIDLEVEKVVDGQPSTEADNKSRTDALLKQMEKVDKEISDVEKKIKDLKEKEVLVVTLICRVLKFHVAYRQCV